MKRRPAAHTAKMGLLHEMIYLRRRVSELEKLESERNRWEEELEESCRQLRRAMEGTIQAMEMTVEMRDPYTAGHQQRVAVLAEAIAREMRLPKDQIEGICMAALIHDLGKIYIPAEILSKPGKLSEFEYVIIKTHPQVGHNILQSVDFPWPIARMVQQHHERLNGSGYPGGISGEKILLESRILAVADIVESMASHRPYRPAVGMDRASEEITQNRGLLYDPVVVDACNKLIHEEHFGFEQPGRTDTVSRVRPFISRTAGF